MRTDHPGLDLHRDHRLGRVHHLPRQLDAAVDRAGVHEHLARAEPPAVDLVVRGVLAQARHERLVHALVLHPQRVDDVGLAQVGEVVAHLAAERLDPPRDQGRRSADGDVRAHEVEREDVRSGDPRVRDVADDPDVSTFERAELLAQREGVQQRLRRVLVLAVAGVDDRGRRPAGDEARGAGVRRADDDRVGRVGGERQHRVLQRLALLDARPAGGEVHDVRADRRLAASSKDERVRVDAS